MHYKNGREANNGDLVIGKPKHGVTTITGIIQDIVPGQETCNCTVIRPGGLIGCCVSVADLFHADDALECAEEVWAEIQAPIAPPVDNAHVAPGCEKFAAPAAV